jgi:hypothetical protein
MGEAGSSNAPHGNINDKNDDDELDDGEEEYFHLQLQCIGYYLPFAFICV